MASPVSNIDHDAQYFQDGDSIALYRKTIAASATLMDWVNAGTIDVDGYISHACATLKPGGGTATETMTTAYQRGRIVHQFRIVRGGRVVYSNELYPSMTPDTVPCGFPVKKGDVVEVRGFTASLT